MEMITKPIPQDIVKKTRDHHYCGWRSPLSKKMLMSYLRHFHTDYDRMQYSKQLKKSVNVYLVPIVDEIHRQWVEDRQKVNTRGIDLSLLSNCKPRGDGDE
jgi:hypothetical protein